MSRTRLTLCLTAALGLLWAGGALADDPKPEKRVENGPTREAPPGERGPRRPAREGDFERPSPDGPDNIPGPGRRRPPREGGFDQPQPPPPREGDEAQGPERRRPAGPPLEGRPGPEGRPALDGRGLQGPPREGRPGPDGGQPRWPHQDWGAMEKSDPEMFKLVREDMELDRRTRELGHQCRQASADKREELKKQLAELVGKQFEIRGQRRTLELKRLEGELTKLRESIERRVKARAEIIERRIAELVGAESDLSF